jgi:hypothetical protein
MDYSGVKKASFPPTIQVGFLAFDTLSGWLIGANIGILSSL